MESLTKIINSLELDKQTCEHMIFKDRENTRNGHKREAMVSHQESFDDFVISSQNEVIFCRKLYSFFVLRWLVRSWSAAGQDSQTTE